jgi:hypothetical protein
MGMGLDITNPDQISGVVERVLGEWGSLDIVVNNAGINSLVHRVTIDEYPRSEWDRILAVDLTGLYEMSKAAAVAMRAKGGGRIINIASMAGLRVLPQIGVYCMSKAAVVHMTRAMALEWGRFGINVNAICPGYIDTEINHSHWQTEQGQKLIQMLPRKRVGEPKDLDAVLVMLCSNESHFINGAVIAADDGFGV